MRRRVHSQEAVKPSPGAAQSQLGTYCVSLAMVSILYFQYVSQIGQFYGEKDLI